MKWINYEPIFFQNSVPNTYNGLVSCVEEQETYKKLLILEEKLESVKDILTEQILPTLSKVSKTFPMVADFVDSKCKKVAKAEKATGNVRDWPASKSNLFHITLYILLKHI